mgnify:CR=1 FL=1
MTIIFSNLVTPNIVRQKLEMTYYKLATMAGIKYDAVNVIFSGWKQSFFNQTV